MFRIPKVAQNSYLVLGETGRKERKVKKVDFITFRKFMGSGLEWRVENGRH